MKTKRLWLLTMVMALLLLLVACGGDGGSTDASTDEPETTEPETTEPETTEPETTEPETTEPEDDTPVSTDDGTVYDGKTAEELQAEGFVVVASGETIRVGASVALTGPIPDPGRDIANGAELAIDDLNAAGGVNGFMYELVLEDGACDGDQGTVVANKFAADPSIVAVSGGTCSGETFGLKPILQEARIPFVSPSATNPDVTDADCDVCNRVALSDALQGEVDAIFALETLGAGTTAVLHDNSDYGLGLAQVYNDVFEANGGDVLSFDGVQVGDTDFRPVLLEISANAPDVLFFGGYATEAALIKQQMEEVGLTDTIFMSDDGAYTQQFLDAAGASAEGSYASFVSGDEVADANATFDAAYEAKYGSTPDDLGPFHGQSYDSVGVIGNAIADVAIESNGYLVIEREALITAIRNTSGYQGLTGSITCDELGNCGAGGIQVYEVVDGEFVQVSGFVPSGESMEEHSDEGDESDMGDMDEGDDADATDDGMMAELAGMSTEELEDAGYVVVEADGTIRVGASVALTGPIPDPGRDIANGAELAIDALNEEGGFEGFMYELVLEDGACDGDQGTVVANKFAADPSIVAVSGGTCSGETFGLVPILQEARIPFVSPSATNPDVISEDCDVCNRVALSDALQGQTDAEYTIDVLGFTNVAILHDNSDYGLGLADVYQTVIEDMGGTVLSFNGVQVGDTDFRPVLLEISADAPEVIFFGGYATEAALIKQQMEEVGLLDTVFFSDDGAFTQQFLDAAGASAEGSYASFVAGDEVADLNEDFDAAYEEKYGSAPDDLGPFHGQSHDSVVIIADAISRAAMVLEDGRLVINREELIQAIRETSEVQGLTGLLSCSADGECGAGGIQIYQVVDGEFVQVSGFGLDE